jgi:response regulator RpfG family c-di-GMP phosphodiesterase
MRERIFEGADYRLLLVDDETFVLHALQRCLRQEGYRIDCIDNPFKALELARQVKYNLIISDYMMPGVDGIMLLSLIRQIQPRAKRFVLSAHTHVDTLLEAINHAKIDRYILKPWEPRKLKFDIRQALEAT